LWSAGCSTGEEAYTLAMICKQREIPAEILGTDVNPQAIASARSGQYASWTLRHVEPELVETDFEFRPDGVCVPTSEISQMVYFSQHNLVTEKAPRPVDYSSGWDLILCRNVLIYYSRSVIAQIAQELVNSLAYSGVLLLGASESLRHLQVSAMAEIVDGRIIYRPGSPHRKALDIKPEEPMKPQQETHLVPPIEPVASSALKEFDSYLQVQELLIQYIREERYDSAISCLEAVVNHNPKDPVANLSLGHTYMLLHNFDAATKCYTTVATLDPLLSETHFFLGILERKRHKLEAAMKWLKKAVFLDPTFWAASYFLATTAQRLGKTAIWERESKRTVELLASRQGTLPMVSHPALHASFIPDQNEVIGSYYNISIVKNAS
jgi:chemotaxis protein methyltransferase CheR